MATIATSSFTVSLGGTATGTGSLAQVNAITGGQTGSSLFDITASFASSLTGGNSLLAGTIYLPHSLTLNTSALGSAGSVTVGSSFFDITGSNGELIKDGVGTLDLTASNSYTGGTEVKAGTLQGTGMSLSGKITVDGGATLNFQAIGGGQSSFFGQIFDLASGIVSVDVGATNKLLFLHDSVNGSGIHVATGATATLNFTGTNATIEGTSADLGASTISTAAHSTIKNFHLGDFLVLDDFLDVPDTSFTVSGGTLTVNDTVHSLTAVFDLANSLTDDPGNEKLVLLHDSATGSARLTAAIDVTATADGTGIGTLRHAIGIANSVGGSHEVIVFDHSISGSTVSLPGNSVTGSVSSNVADLTFFVGKGDAVTIDGGAALTSPPGGLFTSFGFHKSGGGSLTLTGDESNLTGTVTIGSGSLDIETTHLGSTTFHFSTGIDATLAGSSQTLGGRTLDNFTYGDSLKLRDFDFSGSMSLGLSASTLTLTQTSIKPITTTLSLSSSASDFVLLRDSTDGSALIRPAYLVSNATALSTAVTTFTSAPYASTSFDVVDLSGAAGLTLDLTTMTIAGSSDNLALGANPILFDTNGSAVTIDGALSGELWKVGAGTLTLIGEKTDLGTITVGGGELVIGAAGDQFTSHLTKVDLAPGHATVGGTVADLNGLQVTNFHLGNAVDISLNLAGDTLTPTVSGGILTINETGSMAGSASLDISGSLSNVTSVSDGKGGTLIIPVVDGTVTAGPADLGTVTAIDTVAGSTLDLVKGGFYDGSFIGGGTIAIDAHGQTVVFNPSSGNANLGDGTGGSSGAHLAINHGTLDLTGLIGTSGVVTVGLNAQDSELVATGCLTGKLDFNAVAIGSAIDFVQTIAYDPADFLTLTPETVSGGINVLDLYDSLGGLAFETTVPGTLQNTTGAASVDGGLQILPDAFGGVLIAFGNETITTSAASLADNTAVISDNKPITLKVTTPLPAGQTVLDLTSASAVLSTNVNALDVTALGNVTVVLDSSELTKLTTIRGSGATIQISMFDSGLTADLTGHKISGVTTLDVAGSGDTVVVDTIPAGLSVIHGNQNGSDTLLASTATVDLSGIQFTGDGRIQSNAGPTLFTIGDGGVISHIDNVSGSDTINLVAGAPFSADDFGAAFAHGFVLEQNGVTISASAPFTPPGGSPALILPSIGASLSPSGGVAHFVLPPGPQNLSAVSIVGGSDASPVVLFGSPGAPVTLPGSVSGQTNVEFVVNSGNNLITAGSAPAMIWGGSGNDMIHLTTGAGTLVGGSGMATLDGGSANGATFGGSGSVVLFGGQGGGLLSGGGDFSTLISGGGLTAITANSAAGAIHQAFFGAKPATPSLLDCDTIDLSSNSGAQDVVVAGTVSTSVLGHGGHDTVLGGTGSISVICDTTPASTETMLFVAAASSGAKEQSFVAGNSAAQLVAYGGDGMDFLATCIGDNTIVGGTGSEFLAAATGYGYLLSQNTTDTFELHDLSSTTVSGAGTMIIEGVQLATEHLTIMASNTAATTTAVQSATTTKMITLAAADLTAAHLSSTDPLVSHLVGASALQFELADGQVIDLVGVTTLSGSNFSITTPPAL